jgi:predicted CXXCH cytochrome family protein
MVGMKASRVAMVVVSLFLGANAALAQDQCLTCHQQIEDNASALFVKDIHYRKGITCAGCHGGDPTAEEMDVGMNPAKGFIGVPKGDAITERCATCHASKERMSEFRSTLPTSQVEQLQATVHGKLSITGGERIAQCTTCHDAHGIASVKSAASPVHPLNVVKTCGTCHSNASYMRQYNPSLPVDQVEKYRTSAHGIKNARRDTKVAECVSCHGSHDIRPATDVRSQVHAVALPATCSTCHSDVEYMKPYKIPTDQFVEYAKSVHGVALLEKRDLAAPACNDCHGNHGAVPPGVESISKVCGTCHALNADLFSASPHKKAFDAKKLPECETCHGNHAIVAATDALLGVGGEAVCSRCHTPTENVKGYELARTMRALVEDFEALEIRTRLRVFEAEQKGMEVSDAKFKLREVRQARLESRTMIHSFDEMKFREVIDRGVGVATSVEADASAAIEEFFFRRWGLGISTLIITILAVSLYLTIRKIERRQRANNP